MQLKQHARETAVLALPLIISQVGNVITGIVDNIFLGHIGKAEMAAGVLANTIFVLVLVFSIGISYAATPLVSNANINALHEEKAALLKNSLFMNICMSLLLFSVLYCASPLLHHLGQSADTIELAIPFFNVLIFSIIPISIYFTGKQYTEGLSNTKAAMVISVGGNLLNIALNYVLINGHFGLPQMGYMGSCWATFIARTCMALSFMLLIFKHPSFNYIVPYYKKAGVSLRHIRQLFTLGIGSALQFTFEVAAFALSGLIIGWFGKEQFDAHGIAMSLASFTYMLSSGLSGAACIRIANFKAGKDLANLKLAGKSAFIMSLTVMSACALFFLCFNRLLPSAFSSDKEISLLASQLLLIAGLFQLFDGTQVVAQGLLRGLEDVKIPTVITLIAYWVIALPLAYYLGYSINMKAQGVWYALTISLMVSAAGLYLRYRKLTIRMLSGG